MNAIFQLQNNSMLYLCCNYQGKLSTLFRIAPKWEQRFNGVQGGGGQPPLRLEKFRQTLFSGQAQLAQKSCLIKNISIQGKILGQILFFRANASCSKF